MNVILLDNVENLGAIGDLVTVKPGYGRNFLLPSGKAALATKANVAEFESRRADLEKSAAADLTAAHARADLIDGMALVIPANVGSEGKLFGSVGPIDIADAFEKVGVEIARADVRPNRLLTRLPALEPFECLKLPAWYSFSDSGE